MIDCATKMFKAEGAMAFYKGFTPQWMRFGPFTIVQLMVWEKLRDFYGMKGIWEYVVYFYIKNLS